MEKKESLTPKPILKWAGGKSQLLDELNQRVPKDLTIGKVDTYIEPFFGGGALFFSFANQGIKFKNVVICDANVELYLLYKTVEKFPEQFIKELEKLEKKYLGLNEEFRKKTFYKIREEFNKSLVAIDFKNIDIKSWAKRAAYIIFLNKTCFNGLFRVNSKGHFNVPQGKYKNPKILDEDRIIAAHNLLKPENVKILNCDFNKVSNFIDNKTFVYLDPPYRPLNKTSSFTSYSKGDFNDDDQRRLANFYKKMDEKGAKLMLSNSHTDDNFFEDLYKGFKIESIEANRIINSDSSKRGQLKELIITNFDY